jgi:1,2-diacylglycerol 3-alpha-glucosyltransferase
MRPKNHSKEINPMKIALLAQSYPPMVSGASIFVQTLAEHMARRGHQVLVITASDRPSAYLESLADLMVRRVRSHPNPFRVGQRFSLWPDREIATALRQFRPEVVHLHDPFQFALSGISHARQAAAPVVLTVHQLPWFVEAYLPQSALLRKAVGWGLWAYSRWLLKQVDALVTPTRTIARVVSERTEVDSQVIGCGVDTELFHPGSLNPEVEAVLRARLGIPREVPVLLYVGRLDVDKRVSTVVRAAARAMRNNRAHLLVVGDGTEKASLLRLCKDLGIAGRSHFPGYVRVEEGLPDVYRLASLFATASEIETQGIVLLEAGACGLPIAAVEATCIPEIVHNGLNGWVAAPGDVDGLADCMARLLNDPVRACAMGQANRHVLGGFTTRKTIDAYEALYRRTIVSGMSAVPVPGAAWSGRARHSGESD